MHLCGKGYKYFSPHCCKCNSFGCIAAIRCDNTCHGPHSDSVYSGSEHRQFNSPRLVKREAGFPNPRQALIGSNQLWRVNDSPYYRELSREVVKSYTSDHTATMYSVWRFPLRHTPLAWEPSWRITLDRITYEKNNVEQWYIRYVYITEMGTFNGSYQLIHHLLQTKQFEMEHSTAYDLR